MEEEMKRRIDAVLEKVRDPESGLPVAALGVVRKIRFSEAQGILYVFTNFGSHRPRCLTCSAIAMALSAKIQKDLEKEFREAFPDLEIRFV
jgi:metal-sulfur cluster biosynthetic enzyme